VLALAHECVPEFVTKDDGTKIVFYQGPSPDEVTLVDFAKNQGFFFKYSSDVEVKLDVTTNGVEKEVVFPVFRKMEFNSDRKRMSIILRDPLDGLIKMFTKGADSIIKSRLDTSQIDKNLLGETEDFLNKASLKGLRTLLMAMKIIDEDEYKEF
jgi:magnesium-transporting ATPase (P-type)